MGRLRVQPDGRRSHGPHLRTVRDGWRSLRFFLLYSPRWLFLVPYRFFRLRRRLGDSGKEPTIIKTVRSAGYVLAAAVKRAS